MKKTLKIYAFTAALLAGMLLPASTAFAIGEFSLGFNAGITYAPNNIDSIITQYNGAMEIYKQTNAGAKATQIDVPYAPVVGVNARYQFNFFLFRLGCHYSRPLFSSKGSVTTPGGVKNSIKISTYQNSIPATIGIIMPLRKRTYFYIGGGGTLHQAYIKIKQDNPAVLGLTNNEDVYSGVFVAYHLMLGAEVPLTRKYTITAEWIHQMGRSLPLDNSGDTATPRKAINVQGDILLFGVNYYIHI